MTVTFTDLRILVCELDDFGDDPATSSESRRQAIRTAWLKDYRGISA